MQEALKNCLLHEFVLTVKIHVEAFFESFLRLHLNQLQMAIFFRICIDLNIQVYSIQVILGCRNPFLALLLYVVYGFVASYFWHLFLPFCNSYYWKVTNLALILKGNLWSTWTIDWLPTYITWTNVDIWLTTYLPHLVHVVCERPLI